jgi:hypothetical protein
MKLTNKQVEHHFRNENFELLYATEAQIDNLCCKLNDDLPRMLWDWFKEEMASMMAEAKREFG